MDPRLLFVILFIALRVFGVVNRRRKQRQTNGEGMSDLSDRSMPSPSQSVLGSQNPMNPMNRRRSGAPQPAKAKAFHKRDREDPFDGMNGDVTQAKLTMDDIVTK